VTITYLNALIVTLFNHAVECISAAVMKLVDPLAIDTWDNNRLVVDVEVREQFA
jgi:hypothetical protein